MKILHLDIETAPNMAYVWRTFKANIRADHMVQGSYVLCFAAKWHGKRGTMFVRHDKEDIASAAHDLMSEADAIVHYNGNRFDIPHLNRAILKADLKPASPHKNIDLFQVVIRKFKFSPSSLDGVARDLGIGAKVNTHGFETWLGCMAGNETAWRRMERYNRHDVRLTEQIYTKVLPWITNHPHVGLHDGDDARCTNCGSDNLMRNGYTYTQVSRYQKFQCKDCGVHMRSSKRLALAEMRQIV
jgi:DNA polymerase elongation subunit (family B)